MKAVVFILNRVWSLFGVFGKIITIFTYFPGCFCAGVFHEVDIYSAETYAGFSVLVFDL